ncbi:hypothetical protein [Ornithinimicrobium sediminis]|uniref:hypothetical protein n=1 Tax=Ornithinimicrobium sediminis TaxID=2904603 RepID=UPI001E31A901|nr:hypothetical protein [Ornithinimicrobium sediminis]MCE0487654.1 hypothetical protein [Ornithinimicrobium sediminis]
MTEQVAAELIGDLAGQARQPEHVVLEEVELGRVGTAQARGAVDDGVEDLSGSAPFAPQREQDLAAGQGLLASVAQSPLRDVRHGGGTREPRRFHARRAGLRLLGHRHRLSLP